MPLRVLAGRLPFALDAEGLARDAEALDEDDWVPHFNTGVYDGAWSGVAFRSPGGDARRLYPDFFAKFPMADTPMVARCPHVAEALGRLACPVLAARFLRLAPGSVIKPHRDYDLGFDAGEVRLHAAVRTHPDVRFELEGERLPMREGELWYADFSRTHTVINASPVPRIHLVVDCVVDDWLRALVGAASAVIVDPAQRSDA